MKMFSFSFYEVQNKPVRTVDPIDSLYTIVDYNISVDRTAKRQVRYSQTCTYKLRTAVQSVVNCKTKLNSITSINLRIELL